MLLVLVTVIGAVVAGRLAGGRLGNLAEVRIEQPWLVALSVALQLLLAVIGALDGPSAQLGLPLILASHAALLTFVWRNRLLPGMPLIFLGFAGNAVVMAANGAMPVSREALLAVSRGPLGAIPPGKHRYMEDGDRLTFLADILPIPVLHTVVSVGDLVMAAGVGVLVVALMRRLPRPVPADEPAP